ncbi:MAG: DUF1761 domain-containing protein [Casimicrobiaceae bacterium]
MNKRFIVSVVVLFVISMALGFIVHALLLGADYARLPNLMRTPDDAEKYFPFMLLAHVFIALGFTWIYLRGREDKPWLGQGVRFGLAVAVLSTIPIYLIDHAVAPFPIDLVVKQIAFDTISVVLMGVVVAWINRGSPADH